VAAVAPPVDHVRADVAVEHEVFANRLHEDRLAAVVGPDGIL
jgi:hypothetical protein